MTYIVCTSEERQGSARMQPFGWARWRVGAHTVAQAVVATVLAVVITTGMLWVMGVPVAFPR